MNCGAFPPFIKVIVLLACYVSLCEAVAYQKVKTVIKGYEIMVVPYPFITFLTLSVSVYITMFDEEISRIIPCIITPDHRYFILPLKCS